MHKEWIISVILIIGILIANAWTQGQIIESVKEMNIKLNSLKETMLGVIEEEKEIENRNKNEKINEKMEEIKSYWDSKYITLAYFVEHDELEKVNTQLYNLGGNILVQDYEQAMPSLENCLFILEHIKEKNSFILRNIF